MLRYIEFKNANGDGPAWIARVMLSKSGRTVYFNGKALKRSDTERLRVIADLPATDPNSFAAIEHLKLSD